MAKDDLFTISGAKELGKELMQMAQGFQNKMVRPGLNVGVAEFRKDIKNRVPVHLGVLKKEVKSKTFSKGRGKGLVARAGILDSTSIPNGNSGVSIAKYAAVQNYGSTKNGTPALNFLGESVKAVENAAVSKMVARVQEKVTAFHASKGDPGKGKK
jgi:hypothetical protein